jgi:uncharacterized membrane protein
LEWDSNIGPILFLNIQNYKFGFCFCHRMKERSIWFFGLEKIFCSRCLGILFGGIIGLIPVIYHHQIEFFWSILLLLPLCIDGLLQALTHHESNNALRLITGFLFGFGLTLFLTWLKEFLFIIPIFK